MNDSENLLGDGLSERNGGLEALEPLRSAIENAFVRAREHLGLDTSALISDLEDRGPEAVLDSASIPWTPYFKSVVSAGRTDLTLESTILDLAAADSYFDLFLGSRVLAARAKLDSLPELQATWKSLEGGRAESPPWTYHVQGRDYFVDLIYFRTFAIDLFNRGSADCAEVEEAESALSRSSCLDYSEVLHHHILFCPSCRLRNLLFTELHRRIADDQFRICNKHIGILDGQLRDYTSTSRPFSSEQYRRAKEWRTVVLADYLGFSGDMLKFCPVDRRGAPGFHPWHDLRGGYGSPDAVSFVKGLGESAFAAALFAYEIQAQDLNIFYSLCPEGPLQVPGCGDIPEVKGLITPVVTWNVSSWQEWIGNEELIGHFSPGIRAADLLEMASDAVHSHAQGQKDFQPTSNQTESRKEPEKVARRAVGEVFDLLCEEARDKIIDAERDLQSKGRKDYAQVIINYAIAFEMQVKDTILEPLGQKTGDRPTSMLATPLQHQPWPFKDNRVTLGQLVDALSRIPSAFSLRIEALGIDPRELRSVTDKVNVNRNRFLHKGHKCPLEEAQHIRNSWLSVNRPRERNIFEQIVPEVPPNEAA